MPDNENTNYFRLPLSVAGPVDIAKILHELSLIDEHLDQERLKNPSKQIAVKTSSSLSEILKLNNIDVVNKAPRSNLVDQLTHIRKNAPRVNISFSNEAPENFIEKIAEWFRKEVDPYCLIVVGLEPSIGIGSIVRTNNKVFDFSLGTRLKANSKLLTTEIKKLDAETPHE